MEPRNFIRSVCAICLSLVAMSGFIHHPRMAGAQIGVIPEMEGGKEFSESTFKLIGKGCDINTVKGAVNALAGVIDLDSETRKGHLIVYYLPNTVNPEGLKGTIGATDQECFVSIVKNSDGGGELDRAEDQ